MFRDIDLFEHHNPDSVTYTVTTSTRCACGHMGWKHTVRSYCDAPYCPCPFFISEQWWYGKHLLMYDA